MNNLNLQSIDPRNRVASTPLLIINPPVIYIFYKRYAYA